MTTIDKANISVPANSSAIASVTLAPPLFVWGLACLLIAIGAVGVLVFTHLTGMELPGCGPASPCAEAQGGIFGKVPGLGWPVSHVGLAYFAAVLLAWIAFRPAGLSPRFRWLLRLGALGSVGFLLVLAVKHLNCPYCLTAHIANLSLLAGVEIAARPLRRIIHVDLAFLTAAFALLTAVLAVLESSQHSTAKTKAFRELESSLAAPQKETSPSDVRQAGPTKSQVANKGRFIRGATKPKLRLLVYTDYQCEVCVNLDKEIRSLMDSRTDLAITVKHFPLCSDCNPTLAKLGHNPHPHACRAARAVEAAGQLHGNEGFWALHDFMAEHTGNFSDQDLEALLRSRGYDVPAFLARMNGPKTLETVQADIEEARGLGLQFTPMVFLNGNEIRGVKFQGLLTRAVNELAARNPPAMSWSETGEILPDADQKVIEDWKLAEKVTMPPDLVPHVIGGPDASGRVVDVVLWGDYQENNSREADALLRARTGAQPGIRYTFRHYPFDSACNAMVQKSIHPQACLAAQASEAATSLSGPASFWKLHNWNWPNAHRMTRENYRLVAESLGMASEVFLNALDSDPIRAALKDDVSAGQSLNLTSVPSIFIEGKSMTRWKVQDQEKLTLLLDHVIGAPSGR